MEALCDRVSIVRSGAVVETGTLSGLRHLTRTTIAAELDTIPDALRTAPGVHDLAVDGSRVHFDVDTAETDAAMRILVGGRIRSLSATPPTLEELFLRHYGSGDELHDGQQSGRHEARFGAQETAGAR